MNTSKETVRFFDLRVRLGFVLWLLFIFVGFPWLLSMWETRDGGKTKARIMGTRTEMMTLADLWCQPQAGRTGLHLSANGTLLVPLLADQERAALRNGLYRTNYEGELLDFWKTPIQFEGLGLTNVIVRSAGPDRRFGNKDDIVFNSASNSLVKP